MNKLAEYIAKEVYEFGLCDELSKIAEFNSMSGMEKEAFMGLLKSAIPLATNIAKKVGIKTTSLTKNIGAQVTPLAQKAAVGIKNQATGAAHFAVGPSAGNVVPGIGRGVKDLSLATKHALIPKPAGKLDLVKRKSFGEAFGMIGHNLAPTMAHASEFYHNYVSHIPGMG